MAVTGLIAGNAQRGLSIQVLVTPVATARPRSAALDL